MLESLLVKTLSCILQNLFKGVVIHLKNWDNEEGGE